MKLQPLPRFAVEERETVSFRINSEQAFRFQQQCEKFGLTLSEGLRQLIKQYLEESES